MQDETSKSQSGEGRVDRPGHAMPWLESIDESQLPPADDALRRTWLIGGMAILAMVLFSGLIWYLYGRSMSDDTNAPFLVQAPEGPTKVEPAERGGMEVPHQERLVFGRVSGEESPTEENVIEGPEEPLERPQPTAEPTTPSPNEPVEETPGPSVTPLFEEAPPSEIPSRTSPTVLAGSYRLQLGAFGSSDGARASWQTMQNRHANVLAGLDFELEPVTLGDRTLYRLRAGPFATRLDAEGACDQLMAAGQECLLVVP